LHSGILPAALLHCNTRGQKSRKTDSFLALAKTRSKETATGAGRVIKLSQNSRFAASIRA